MDANQGLVLFGDDKGNFINQTLTGFKAKGEVKAMRWFTNKSGKRYLIVGVNNDFPKIFSVNE